MKRFLFTVWCLFAAATLAAKVTTFDNFEYKGRPLLLPDVQKYQAGEGAFAIPAKFTVAFPKGEDIVLEQLADELKRFPGVTASAAEGSDAVCRFVLTEKDVPEHKEGYTLRIDDKGVTVSARTTAGLFYGAQTLRGMIRNVARAEFPKCFITDWPDLDMRSFTFNISHMPSSKMPLLKRTLDILAGLKINTLFIGISSAFPYKNNPLTLRKNAFTEAEMRDLADFCRRRHFELIPMMQIFSHSAWMMNHPDWPKMREDRAKPRSYSHSSQWCPLNEQAWQIAEELVAQQIAFFKPRYFYPVFDEICLCPFHECEDCVKQDPRKLLSDTLRRVEGMIVRHGATPLYCHDNFFSRSIWPYGDWYRTQLKPGTIIRYWKYDDQIPEEQLNALKDFKLLGNAVWGKPFNVYNLAHAIKRHNGIGCGMVYFYFSGNAGFFANYLHETPDSLGGIVNSAGYLWKLDDTLPYDLTYDGTLDMMRRLDPERSRCRRAENARRRCRSKRSPTPSYRHRRASRTSRVTATSPSSKRRWRRSPSASA